MNKKIKLKAVLVILVVSVLFLSACSSTPTNGANAAGEEQVYTLKLASAIGDWTNLFVGAEDFKRAVEERSEGRIKVELFPDAQLGDEREILESLQTGNIELAYASTITFNSFDERIMFLDLPYLFEDYDEAEKAMDGTIGDAARDVMIDKGVRPLAFGHGEFRWINSRNKPISVPSDMKGTQFRVPLSNILVKYYTSMGVNAVTMGNSEVYTALQQGVVDGYDNGAELVLLQKFYENTKYSTMTNHNYYPMTVSVSEKVWNTLPEDLQSILESEAQNAMEAERQAFKNAVPDNIQKLKDNGIEIIELSEAEKEQWRQAAQPLYDQIADVVGEELYQLVLEEKENDFSK
ncbi:TRAP transporter substrate-binding protein [Sporosarcina sp. 179-K 3D1 HS]|uniref:TRAP transporter substrate-binding protein n=1 Tax=Sporosarcina sp. 179-K 3D1 HS TaxID=3232169 RepID=UPI0039A2DC47